MLASTRRDCSNAQSIHDLPQIPECCSPTKYARGSCISHKDVVMLFCPSFSQSESFLHTHQLITILRRVEPATCCSHDKLHSHVVGKNDRFRVQVRCSDLVGSDLPHSSSMFDKMLHLSKSQGSSMSRLKCHDLREAISDLLTVSMHLQDSLSRFHRPGLHTIDIFLSMWRVRRLAPLRFTSPKAAELSVRKRTVPSEQLHILLH